MGKIYMVREHSEFGTSDWCLYSINDGIARLEPDDILSKEDRPADNNLSTSFNIRAADGEQVGDVDGLVRWLEETFNQVCNCSGNRSCHACRSVIDITELMEEDNGPTDKKVVNVISVDCDWADVAALCTQVSEEFWDELQKQLPHIYSGDDANILWIARHSLSPRVVHGPAVPLFIIDDSRPVEGWEGWWGYTEEDSRRINFILIESINSGARLIARRWRSANDPSGPRKEWVLELHTRGNPANTKYGREFLKHFEDELGL